jgi:hypothetical protein
MTNPQRHGGEKALLIIVSLSLGLTVGIRNAVDFTGVNPVIRDGGILAGFFLGALVALVYTILAGVGVSLCEGMKWIAYRGQAQRWDDGPRIVLGAIWPLTLVCCTIVYAFLAVTHRLF